MPTSQPDIVEHFYLLANDSQKFPGRDGNVYIGRYQVIYQWVVDHIYPYISALASIEDDNRGFLTGHDQRHTQTVMERAWQLISRLEIDLQPFEFYTLIVAILIHDVGNIRGREMHERNISRIVNDTELKILMGNDRHERSRIIKIAEAHGGLVRGTTNDKDTLRNLEGYDFVGGYALRSQLLAAILRLADELAEEPARASRFVLQNQSVPESEIYHAYALALNTTRVNKDTRSVDLIFTVDADDMIRTWSYLDKTGQLKHQFLLEYIFERSYKTYIECLYCMRYIRNADAAKTYLDAVKIEIQVYGNDDVIKRIADTMRESGYPTSNSNIRTICPLLAQVTGESLKLEIEGYRIELDSV